MNIAYYNSFERMEARLRNHVTAMPKIINSNLVQVNAYLIMKITCMPGSTSCQRGSYGQTDSDRILRSGKEVANTFIWIYPKKYVSANSSWLSFGTRLFCQCSGRKM